MHSTPAQLRSQTPRRRSRRLAPRRRQPVRWRLRLLFIAVLAGCVLVGWAALARALASSQNTGQAHFDAIIVLGNRLDSDGNPTPALLARVAEGVHEYERGVAPRLVLTGGPTRPPYSDEAQVMERVAESEGVPESAIFLEPRAMDTIQNACYSARVLKAHGWHSAEIVTSSSHVPRAGIIFSRTLLAWRMHPAPSIEQPSQTTVAVRQALEILKTMRYLVYADWAERCSP